MAQTPSTWDDYVGDGVEDTFQVTFPYQKQQEVFVTVDGNPAAFTFVSAGWIQLVAVPASGTAIRVQRSTEAFEPRHEFANGVPLLPRFIDENNKQFLYVVQEAVNETAGVAADALSAAEGAVVIAQTASDKVDAATLDSALVLRQELVAENGGEMVGYIAPVAGAVRRTVKERLSDQISIKDFGALGDGTADDSVIFQAAVNSVPAGAAGTFLVPAGTYRLDSDVSQNGRFVTFLCAAGVQFTGEGELETNFVLYDQYGGLHGSGRHGFGSNVSGGGVLVGGGVPGEGGQGMFLSSDGHANWMRAQTSINYNPTELLLYSASGQGRAISVVGGGFIDRTEGAEFDPDWVGRPFYFNYKKYEVKSFVSVNRIELQEVGGAAVSFASAAISAYHFVMTTGAGSCSVSGSTLTRIDGQPFVPFVTYPGFTFKLNGSPVTVASFISPNQVTLTAPPGDTASTPYFYELDINGQISTVRVQKQFGTTEENFTISARAIGEYELRAGVAGNGEYYPIKVYNGSLAAFTPQPVAVFSTNGRVGISPNVKHTPAARLHVADVRAETYTSGLYNEASRISTSWADGARALEFGQFSVATQGGYLQGRDGAGNTYDVSINPRGGNVGIGLNNPVMKLTVAGVVGPAADNTYSLGQSGARWSSIWAATGTIQTSDARTKTDVQPTPLGLDFINQLRPVSYRFKVGGQRIDEQPDGYDELTEQAVELVEQQVAYTETELIDGKKVLVTRHKTETVERPLFDLVEDIFDEQGNPLPSTRVPRMVTRQVPRTKVVETQVAGRRTHYGLIAQEVKQAADALGVDFGGYIEGDDGMLGLRYEELIAPLIRAVQELSQRVAELESKLQ